MWGRYLTWTFSTPLILLALGLLVGSDRPTLFAAIASDVGMCVTGLAAALTRQAVWMRWVWFGISSAFFRVGDQTAANGCTITDRGLTGARMNRHRPDQNRSSPSESMSVLTGWNSSPGMYSRTLSQESRA